MVSTSSDSIIPSGPYVMESLSMDGTMDIVSPAITPPQGIIHPSPTIATTSLRQDTVTSYYGTKMMLVSSIPISASVSGTITPSTYTIMDVVRPAITLISPSPQRTTIEQSPTISTTTSISATITQTPLISTTPSPTPLTDEHSLDRVLESLFIESDNLIATTYNLSFILRGVGQNQTVELEISEVYLNIA
jgi:archaellum component FlaG (FlaF/FlaG flagellin family)